jgi:hypothetical protein
MIYSLDDINKKSLQLHFPFNFQREKEEKG